MLKPNISMEILEETTQTAKAAFPMRIYSWVQLSANTASHYGKYGRVGQFYTS